MRATILRLMLGLAVVSASALSATPAAAQGDDSLRQAKEYFDKAKGLFQSGSYKEAAELFDKAYKARPFPQFLFNIGACHEKLQEWQTAVDYYNRYLSELPNAADADALKKRIAVLKAEVKKAADAAAKPKPALPEKCKDPAVAAADPECKEDPNAGKPPAPSEDVKKLANVGVRGVVVIESEPSGATIYIDSKKKKPLAKTPWAGNLKSGQHTIFIERKGYKPIEVSRMISSDSVNNNYFAMAEEDYLGWLDIKSNVPGAEIFIDDKATGSQGKTPWGRNLPPGKHKVWVTKEGYTEFYKEIDIVRGQTHTIDAKLKGSEVGYLSVRGDGIEYTAVYLDGKLLCERGPCRKGVAEGTHTVEFKRKDYKPYKRRVVIQQKTETTVFASLVEEPGRGDAVTAYVFSAIFLAGGITATVLRGNIKSELEDEINNGELTGPPTTSDDKRFGFEGGGKLMAGLEIAGYSLAGISLAVAVWRTFRDKGPPSTGRSDVKAIAVTPTIGPDHVGVGLGFDF